MATAGLRAPYGRRSEQDRQPDRPAGYPGPTYYDLPVVKKSHWRWLIAGYLFVGGLAGASQVVAAAADLVGRERQRAVVRGGRYLALLGAALSPIFLIADLHSPARWYNMLRIFRPTSPMSLGSWALAGFGLTSGLAALAQLLEDLTGDRAARRLGRLVGLPAAALGGLVATYTATLLSATSIPLWSAVYRRLPILFGATAMASAGAALSLLLRLTGAPISAHRALDRLALFTGAVQLGASLLVERQWRRQGVGQPVEGWPLGLLHRVGVQSVGMLLPLGLQTLQLLGGGRGSTLPVLAGLAALVGAFAERVVLVFGGRASGDAPRDYFHLTRPDDEPREAPR